MGRKRFFLNVLLILVCAFLAYELYEVLLAPAAETEVPVKAQERDRKSKETLAILPLPPPKAQYNIIGQNTPFRPQRAEWTQPEEKPKQEPAQAEKRPAPELKKEAILLDQIKLYGAAIYGDGKKIAILELPKTPQDPKGGFRSMRPGDMVAGYLILDILDDRVLMEKDGKSLELLVRDPKKPKARPSPAQTKPTDAAKAFQALLKSKAEEAKQKELVAEGKAEHTQEQKQPPPQDQPPAKAEAPPQPGVVKKVINTPFGPKVIEESQAQ